MSNVLPREAKVAVWRIYRARFITAGSLIMLGVAALSALALSPSYFALQVEEAGSAAKNPSIAASMQQDRDAIIHTQALVSALSPILAAPAPTASIEKVITARPAGITINHITITTGSSGSLIISGTAKTNEAISRYQSALRADSSFTGVVVPVGDLAGTGNGDFSITLTGTF